jgi:hypothetical protein
MKAELDVFHREGIHIDRKILRPARHAVCPDADFVIKESAVGRTPAF